MIWDIETDPMNPKLLGKFECKGMAGVHRFFYNGGRYVYCVGNKPGFFKLFILRIIDIQDPTHPVEVGSWWADNQYRANKPGGGHVAFGSKEFLEMATVHAVTVKDHICYAAVANFWRLSNRCQRSHKSTINRLFTNESTFWRRRCWDVYSYLHAFR